MFSCGEVNGVSHSSRFLRVSWLPHGLCSLFVFFCPFGRLARTCLSVSSPGNIADIWRSVPPPPLVSPELHRFLSVSWGNRILVSGVCTLPTFHLYYFTACPHPPAHPNFHRTLLSSLSYLSLFCFYNQCFRCLCWLRKVMAFLRQHASAQAMLNSMTNYALLSIQKSF